MTLADLLRSARQALATGQVGTPVSLKLWLHLASDRTATAEWFTHLVEAFVPMLDDPPATLLAQSSEDGSFRQGLLTGAAGRTAVVSVSVGAESHSKVQFLLVGSRGVVQLSGTAELDHDPLPISPHVAAWNEAFQSSRRDRRATAVKGILK